MAVNNYGIKFSIRDKLKPRKPGKHLQELEFQVFPTDTCICIIDVAKEYLERTSPLPGQVTSLFIT